MHTYTHTHQPFLLSEFARSDGAEVHCMHICTSIYLCIYMYICVRAYTHMHTVGLRYIYMYIVCITHTQL